MRTLRVHHFGPDTRSVGGMGSVIHTLAAHGIGADAVEVHATWVAGAAGQTVKSWLRALLTVARLPREEIVHVHLSERGSFVREGAVLLLARVRGLGTVSTLHGADFDEFAGAHPRVASVALRSSRVITALSQASADVAAALAPGSRVAVIPNPVEPEIDPSPAGEVGPEVLFAGEVGTRKGVDVLLAAWEQVRRAVPEARLTIAGPEGDMHVSASEGVAVPGPRPREEIRKLIASSRAVVLPSRAEAMPMFLLEAAAGARPFVATPVGGVASIAQHGGRLVPVGDADALAASLIELLQHPETATSVGMAGWREVSEERSPAVVGARLRVEAYERCLPSGAAG